MLFLLFFDNINNRGGGNLSNHAGKKDFFYIIVLILTFITFVVGMTFAIYSWIFSHPEGSSAVYTGTLAIKYLSGDLISFDGLYPNERPTFDTTENVYRNRFRVENTGSLTGVLEIKIVTDVNEFSPGMLKYILYNSSGDEIVSGNLDGVLEFVIASNVILEGHKSEDFVLVVWLNENYLDQSLEMKKTYIGAITIDASQKKD